MPARDRTEELVATAREHIIHGFAPVKSDAEVVFEEGHGVTVRDTRGKEYLDFSSGVMNVNIGHGRKELAEAALAQMSKLGYFTAIRGFSHTAVIECAKKLTELTPEGLDRFFFCSGGSEANESAVKIVRVYWRNQGKDKYKIISLNNSYHGVTYGILGATAQGRGAFWEKMGPLLPGFVHIPNYHCYRCSFGLEYPDCDTRCARFLAEVIENENQNTVAAFIAEPVQGGGGFIIPPPTYWPLVRQICREHEVLLIADEVITGFGRTGKMFALEHWGVRPDIMTMAKGITSGYLPFAAAAVSDEVFAGLAATDAPFMHAYTYSGHPVCCAVAIKNMEIVVQEKLVENAAKMGHHILNRLQSEFTDFDHVADVSGLGLLCSFELVADKTTKTKFDPAQKVRAQVVRRARAEGLVIRELGERVGLAPPLIVTTEEADRAIDTLKPIVANIRQLLD